MPLSHRHIPRQARETSSVSLQQRRTSAKTRRLQGRGIGTVPRWGAWGPRLLMKLRLGTREPRFRLGGGVHRLPVERCVIGSSRANAPRFADSSQSRHQMTKVNMSRPQHSLCDVSVTTASRRAKEMFLPCFVRVPRRELLRLLRSHSWCGNVTPRSRDIL